MAKNKKISRGFNLANIKVVGVGGAGGHIITRMAQKEGIKNAEFIVINTDAQDLEYAQARKKIYIGKTLTKGLGAGMNPELGKQAAEENRSEISEALQGADIVFIAAGLGGGTGSLGSGVVADIAREMGALTIAVVTKPFSFEGAQRMKIAQEALAQLKTKVDTLVVIPNDRIFNIINKDTSLIKAFEFIDDVLKNAVQAITELIVSPGVINLDFADIKAVMKDAGAAIIGIGVTTGAERAVKAVNAAINSPLLEASIDGAKGVLFSISGGRDLKMSEIQIIAKLISDTVDPGAKVIFGAYYDRRLPLKHLKVTIIATGFGFNGLAQSSKPVSLFTSYQSDPLIEARELDVKKKEEPTEERVKLEEKTEIPSFLRRKKHRQ
ncbi:MAG: cell division protein FtsZ [Patescibacteria group bacterium]